ncbi:hypothetical protein SETIT_9G206100v2 [Setaria italica]|uniref:Phospholipid/glycerol acyltransferase domain-containing protein n=1 Tax=Setaria italica TaxID=4555 RepID=A0A368SIQ6_SETIT|nr:hypothetical protein SETIT_9G206100v2 [Setaria italica]
MGTLLRPGPAAAAPPIPVTSSSAHVAAVGGGGFGARSSRHRVSVGAFWTPSPQVLETRWRQRRRDTVVVRSDVVAGGAAAAAGDSTQALSGRCFKFISKTSIFMFPIIGWAMYLLGVIPLRRMDSRSQLDCLKRCVDLVGKGASVFFFPEGTRRKNAETLCSEARNVIADTLLLHGYGVH